MHALSAEDILELNEEGVRLTVTKVESEETVERVDTHDCVENELPILLTKTSLSNFF